MMTNAAAATPPRPANDAREPSRASQKVLIVNGTSDVLELLENVLDAGHYDVVFVESSAHAYSQIKRVQPHLVILCVRIDDPDSLQVLSMLTRAEEPRAIRVLTYTTEYGGSNAEDGVSEPSDTAMFTLKPAI